MIRLNIRRKLFHLFSGLGIIVLIYYGIIDRFFLLLLLILGVILSLNVHRIPYLHRILQIYERPRDLIKMPGRGAITLVAGLAIPLFIFPWDIALASMCVLAIGDSLSTIVGLKMGKTKFPFSCKTLEGSLAGLFVSLLACLLILNPLEAVACAFFGMAAESFDILEDNISVPLAAGSAAFLIGMI
jgi:phytol kinase